MWLRTTFIRMAGSRMDCRPLFDGLFDRGQILVCRPRLLLEGLEFWVSSPKPEPDAPLSHLLPTPASSDSMAPRCCGPSAEVL